MKCLKRLQRFWRFTSEACFASRLVTRAVFALFLFFCVASSPGLAQVLIAAVPPITEEQHETRESLMAGSTAPADQRSRPSGLREPIVEPRGMQPLAVRPLLAASGHRLANGHCAPLLR
jgi:hypothetical protein